MSTIFDIFFPSRRAADLSEEQRGEAEDFIRRHTLQIAAGSRMVIIPEEEFANITDSGSTTAIPVTDAEEQPAATPAKPVEIPAAVAPETVPAAKPTALASPAPAADNTAMLASMEKLQSLIERENHKDDIIRELHKERERLSANFFDDIKRPMIKSIIAIHRQMINRMQTIRQTATDADTNYEKLYRELCKNMEFDATAVSDTLEDEYDLTYFEPKPGDAYNPKENNAVRVVTTNDPAQGGIIQEVIYGGFKNVQTEKIFLKANVIVYKYQQ